MKYFILAIFLAYTWPPFASKERNKVVMSKAILYDKIKGGWAGQVIGVTYASDMSASASMEKGPSDNAAWSEGYQVATFQSNPGLYDDIYIDLTFLEALQEYGTDLSAKKLADIYMNAAYEMNHGCQSARYNLLKGKNPQRAGHWLDNPHADDNDFQSHADFIGLMYPGLPNTASDLASKVGHLMNYGDGYYGGLYIATLYSLAFTTNDREELVALALKSIPEKSTFYQCVNYAREQYKQYPYAWDRALGHFQRKWADGFGCPDRLTGIEDAEAKINSAYLTLALLYGESDFEKTLQIMRSIRQADCNVATVAGILGVMNGFEKIPSAWKQGIDEIETLPFHHSNLSLAEACDITFRNAVNAIKESKGSVGKEQVVIVKETPTAAKFEKSFEGHYPKEVRNLNDTLLADRLDFEFEGIGFVVRGSVPEQESDEMFTAELYMNNKYIEVIEIPLRKKNRAAEVVWKFQLPHDMYSVSLRPLTKNPNFEVRLTDLVVYDVTPN